MRTIFKFGNMLNIFRSWIHTEIHFIHAFEIILDDVVSEMCKLILKCSLFKITPIHLTVPANHNTPHSLGGVDLFINILFGIHLVYAIQRGNVKLRSNHSSWQRVNLFKRVPSIQ